MLQHMAIICPIILFVVFGAGVAMADDPSAQDKAFIAMAASASTLEVRLGQYASQNASSDDVKKFAEHMVGDHGKAREQLKTLATQKPIEIPKVLSDEDQQILDRLEKLNGPALDKAYMSQMVEDHKKVVAAFEKEINEGSEITIKAFAEKLLPTLKSHLEMAQILNSKLSA